MTYPYGPGAGQRHIQIPQNGVMMQPQAPVHRALTPTPSMVPAYPMGPRDAGYGQQPNPVGLQTPVDQMGKPAASNPLTPKLAKGRKRKARAGAGGAWDGRGAPPNMPSAPPAVYGMGSPMYTPQPQPQAPVRPMPMGAPATSGYGSPMPRLPQAPGAQPAIDGSRKVNPYFSGSTLLVPKPVYPVNPWLSPI